jgi:hypothetical protein
MGMLKLLGAMHRPTPQMPKIVSALPTNKVTSAMITNFQLTAAPSLSLCTETPTAAKQYASAI